METMEQLTPLDSPVWASPRDGNFEDRTDLYIEQGQIGEQMLNTACFTWTETLRVAATELWRRGEAERARVTLKARHQSVREFLWTRFGIITGARELWHRENWTPDRADLHEFLGALRDAKGMAH